MKESISRSVCLNKSFKFLCGCSTGLCVRIFVMSEQLSDFDSAFCLSLVTGSLVKSKLGQRFSLGSGGSFSRGGVRKGVVFGNLGLFWSAV